MTMDIANQTRTDLKMPSPAINEDAAHTKSDYPITATKTSSKRSFDVAFLMLPDEKMKQKQLEKQARIDIQAEEETIRYPTHQITVKNDLIMRQQMNGNETKLMEQFETSMRARHQNGNHIENHQNEDVDIMTNSNSSSENIRNFRYNPTHSVRLPRVYDDPTILPSPDRGTLSDLDAHKSAFTKVPHARLESPNPPLSPDQLSCPSTSPPVSVSPPRQYNNFRPEYPFMNGGAFQSISQHHNNVSNKMMKQQFMYRPSSAQNHQMPDIPPGYLPTASFPFGATNHPFVQQPDITGMVRNPAAAAILSTLIPPTIASTLTLTAQNVCAKCNISFRMTSDLVYHMRSHHKNDMCGDPHRRKREEKLKCPVCNESFRERHHLTRHMTAHQDKASDETDGSAANINTTMSSTSTHHDLQHSSRRHKSSHSLH